MKILAPAKINLCLDVLGRDVSKRLNSGHHGYHEIVTVYQTVPELYNEIEITPGSDSSHSSDATSQAVVELLIQNFPRFSRQLKSTSVKITSHIPNSSGLGGASSTAAAILKGLNKLHNLRLSKAKLLGLAAQLGMDVPFFIVGGTALGVHYGEKIIPLPPVKALKFTVTPLSSNTPSKTQSNYARLDLAKCGRQTNKTELLIQAIKNQDTRAVIDNLHNDFETLVPVGAGEHLSGSGPSTFKAAKIPPVL